MLPIWFIEFLEQDKVIWRDAFAVLLFKQFKGIDRKSSDVLISTIFSRQWSPNKLRATFDWSKSVVCNRRISVFKTVTPLLLTKRWPHIRVITGTEERTLQQMNYLLALQGEGLQQKNNLSSNWRLFLPIPREFYNCKHFLSEHEWLETYLIKEALP